MLNNQNFNKRNEKIKNKQNKKMLTKSKIIGLVSASLIIIVSIILLVSKAKFFDIKTFNFVLGLAVVIGGLPFFMALLVESKREKDIEVMFLEFSRDLVEGVKSGTPISKSIINLKGKDYGSLSPNIQKLANQISLGIPVKQALDNFALDIKSPIVSRAISLIREAEKSGGKIESILESVTFSISQIEKLKKERKAAIYNLVVQGYIIFLIFIVIMLVMEFKILPMTADLNVDVEGVDASIMGAVSQGNTNAPQIKAEDFAKPFLFLLLTQGLFAGLVIGKISEGDVKSGLKHSFILVILAWLLSSGAERVFLK